MVLQAEAILQLAASPVSFPHEILADQRTTPWSIPCHSQAASVKTTPCSQMIILPPQQTGRVLGWFSCFFNFRFISLLSPYGACDSEW